MQTYVLSVHSNEPEHTQCSHTLRDDAGNPIVALPDNVMTIGNFDGVHRGHQAMIEQLSCLGDKLSSDMQPLNGLKRVVMSFEPQPREYFALLNQQPNTAPARLTTLSEKQSRLSCHDVDIMLVATFDDAFRALSAMQFANLLKTLNVQGLVLGDDFRFGHDRTGDGVFLAKQDLTVVNLSTITDTSQDTEQTNGEVTDSRISSTRIRQALQRGELDMANHLLGYDYRIIGPVVSGDQIGRTLNFPTANVALNRLKPALHGVFVVEALMLDTKGDVIESGFADRATSTELGLAGEQLGSLFGVASVGTRPSIDGATEWRLEVHFPNYKGDLYDTLLSVRFLHFLHGERKYDGLEALKAGIAADTEYAINWCTHQSP